MGLSRHFLIAAGFVLTASGAHAQASTQIGTLACDVSKGVGMFVVQKQTLSCVFRPDRGKPERYSGTIDQFGVALGEVQKGHLIWGVLAASRVPKGSLAGSYGGVGANASLGVGAGANVLVGGTNNSISLQPISVQGQQGINIAGGVTTVTLKRAK